MQFLPCASALFVPRCLVSYLPHVCLFPVADQLSICLNAQSIQIDITDKCCYRHVAHVGLPTIINNLCYIIYLSRARW